MRIYRRTASHGRHGDVIEAGILAGLLFRLGGLRAGQELAALNDATLYLHALSQGQVILTRNLRDFDVLNQILLTGRSCSKSETNDRPVQGLKYGAPGAVGAAAQFRHSRASGIPGAKCCFAY